MKRNWYAVLTADVLYDHNLTDTQKILYAVISNLSDDNGECYPTNGYLANIMNSSEETIRRHLQALEAKGYILRYMRVNNVLRQRILKIHKIVDTTPQDYGVQSTKLRGIKTNTNNKEENTLLVSTKVDTKDPQEFEKVWNLYGNKVGKQPAFRSWKRLSANDRKKVLEHIPKYLENHDTAGKMKFLPHLATYLNQKRYEELLPYEQQKSNTGWELS